jgi:hypothetical protein
MRLPSRYRYSTRVTLDGNVYYGGRPPVVNDPRMDDVYYEVGSGESYQSVAHSLLGDFRLWWVVADFNDVMNPMEELVPGQTLRVPSRGRLWMEVLT